MANRETGLWYRCRDFVEDQAQGEWSDEDIENDADRLADFVMREMERVWNNARIAQE